eukprot:373721-Heterocapsa_arctica.AAC.1
MIEVLLTSLRRVWKRTRTSNEGEFRVAFEWPRESAGWHEPALQPLLKALPHVASFDGCAYGLRSIDGQAVKKPWL